MSEEMKAAKKKVAVVAASLGFLTVTSATLPEIAVRHGLRAVWIVIPLVAIEVVAMVYVLIALFDLKRLEKASADEA